MHATAGSALYEMETLVDSPPASGLRTNTPARTVPDPGPLNRKDYAVGIGLLLIVVLLWTASNFVTQNLFVNGYEKPFLVTYLNTSAFAFYLIPFCFRTFGRKGFSGQNRGLAAGKGVDGIAEEYQPLATSEPVEELGNEENEDLYPPVSRKEEEELPPLTVRQTAELASAFCLLWFVANWAVNASLDYTTVASSTILASTSGFFTLGIGRIFKVEKLTLLKIGAVFTSFVGVLLVSLSDSSQSKNPADQAVRLSSGAFVTFERAPRPLLGDALALFSALFYAFYVILLKVRVKQESRMDVQLFFGFVGLFNILMCWPLGFVLHWTGVEKFKLPSNSPEWYAIIVNMAITLSSDYLYVLAMLRTTPLVVTVGISLTIPVAVLGDFVLNVPVRIQVMIGAALVLVSFVAIGTDSSNTEQAEVVPRGSVE